MNEPKNRAAYAFSLLRHTKGLSKYVYGSILVHIAFKLVPIVISLLTAYITGASVTGGGFVEWLAPLLAGVAVLIVASSILSYLDVLVSHDMAYKILTKLRELAYDKVDELAPGAMEDKRSGDITSIFLEDIEQLELFYAHVLNQLVTAAVIPIAALVFLFTVSPAISIVFLPFIACMIIVPVKSARKGDKQGGEVRKAFGAVSALVVDGVQGLKDIISFQWHKPFYERYNAAAQKHFAAQLTFAMRSANETRWLQLITGVGGLCGQIAAAALVISGKVNAIWLIPVFSLSSAVFSPLYEALSLSTNYGLIFGAAKRVFDLFQAKPSVEDSGTLGVSDVLNDNPVTVSFENVSFTYPARDDMSANARVLEGLRFSVKAGETVALTGASGSGKTTAAKLLQRFWDADDGRIMINGVDVRELRLDALREIITVVPQDAYLFHASVEENLKMAKPSATHEELRRAAADARADLFIEKLPQGYGTMVGERGLRLSGGEKQRLSIAQAFLKDSPVLVLDEASANLDSENESRINEAVSRLKAGRATIVIAHRVSTIKAADRVIVLRDGRVEAEGVFDKLVAECPYFRELIGGEYREEA